MKKLLALLVSLLLSTSLFAAKQPGDFPRLLGMNIGKKHYDDPTYQAELAKLDIVILGFFPGWNPRNETDPIGSVLRNLKRLNPAIRIGQYTILNEAYDDPAIVPNQDIRDVLNGHHWWLLNAAGKKVQWTPKYKTWETNATQWAPTGAKGERFSDWLAERNSRLLFEGHPEFDLWYCDNVMWRPRVTGDWDRDGQDDNRNDPKIQAAYREGMAHYWAAIRKVQPTRKIMGNADSDLSEPEFRQKMDGAFLEGWMGASYSIEKRAGWAAAMDLYRRTKANLPPGAIISVNIHAPSNDFQFFRYALASCLMDDGYFSFSDAKTLYSTVSWFDEYDVALGSAKTLPPQAAWKQGVWRRDFAGGVALVNPTDAPVTVTIERGFRKLRGQQAPKVNDGSAVSTLTLAAKDGIILERQR